MFHAADLDGSGYLEEAELNEAEPEFAKTLRMSTKFYQMHDDAVDEAKAVFRLMAVTLPPPPSLISINPSLNLMTRL